MFGYRKVEFEGKSVGMERRRGREERVKKNKK